MTSAEIDHKVSECKKVIREMIKHENELINHRLTWLCQIQGFLFAALAVTWNFSNSIGIRYMFCLAGVLVAISSHYGLDIAIKAIKVLYEKGEKLDSLDDCDPFIGFKGNESTLSDKCLPWRCLPGIFVLVWMLIFFILWNPFSANGSTYIIYNRK